MSENATAAVKPAEVGPGLYLIPGHHPASMWTDSNVPNVMALHSGRELYLLDTGLGPAQRQAIAGLGLALGGQLDRVTLLNSHGHADHMGNNDVLPELGVTNTRHYLSEKSAPYFDTLDFFRRAYNEGGAYFNYITGLDLSADALMPLLTRAGLDPHADPARLAAIGRDIADAGLTSVISHFMGDLMIRNISETYPPVHIHVDGAQFYEATTPQVFRYGDAEWSGWQIGDVCVFQAGGHTPDGVMFYLPDHRFLFLADETTTIPIWSDTNPGNAARNLGKVLAMVDAGAVVSAAAGHFPLDVITGADNVRAAVNGYLGQKSGFESAVCGAQAAFRNSVTIDELYDYMAAHATRMTRALLGLQFPRMPTFFKLTLLNYCREHLAETRNGAGQRAFKVRS
jgi:glyoxylase-like metal-dependent hydrolase (beta-lactamase superfamily II)